MSDPIHRELRRGAVVNTLAMLAANFRAIFTILVARLLGPVALGVYSVAWATTDLVSKIGVLGLDDGVTTFVARANAVRDLGRCRSYFHAAAAIALFQSTIVAVLVSAGLRWFGYLLALDPKLISAVMLIVFSLPGIALYRVSTSVSRGLKVMEHDIYSRGLTESGITTAGFLVAFALGSRLFSPEIGAVVGCTASGVLAFVLAAGLFRTLPNESSHGLVIHARQILAYSIPIGADQLLNAFIWRIDLILLAFFVGRAPGVTLTTLGIYGAVVGIANGLRKVSQSFVPIFAPVVAGMTATGDHDRARATYAQLAQWMLWILLPFVAVLALAGNTILFVFGHGFQGGRAWLTIVAIACATNAFINLGETVIMVQRPRLNLLNSFLTCFVGTSVTYFLVLKFGVIGAACGMFFTYLVQGLVRNIMLRFVFHWTGSWGSISKPLTAAIIAGVPAILLHAIWQNRIGGLAAAVLFLLIFGLCWLRKRGEAILTT